MSFVTLMEGSFGSHLRKYVGDRLDGDPLWSARILATDREKCIFTHRDLVKAGAEIITTGSYQATVDGFIKHLGVDKEKALLIIKDSVICAREAINLAEKETGKKFNVRISGCIGSYGAHLNDGSEYTGSYGPKVSTEELMDWHRPKLEALIDCGVDFIGFQTIPLLKEAEALIQLLKNYPSQKAWLSFSCKDNAHISSGESFYNAVIRTWELGASQLIAIGVNCLNPAFVTPLFTKVKETHPQIPLLALPNSGETFDKKLGKWVDKGTSKCLTDYTNEWLNLGINYLGGCCRTNNKDIMQFKEEIKKWKRNNSNN